LLYEKLLFIKDIKELPVIPWEDMVDNLNADGPGACVTKV